MLCGEGGKCFTRWYRAPAALIIDYGDEHGFRDSFRGIRDHKFVNPLSNPGLVDLVRPRR